MDHGAQRFFTYLDNATTAAESSPVGLALKADSPAWHIAHTGGGCLAWEYVMPDGYIWITDESGCDVPKVLSDRCMVGIYESDGDSAETACPEFEGIAAALAYLTECGPQQ